MCPCWLSFPAQYTDAQASNEVERELQSSLSTTNFRHWLAILCQDTYLPASVPQDNALAIKGSLVLLITMDA
jgi:hypothetical protein